MRSKPETTPVSGNSHLQEMQRFLEGAVKDTPPQRGKAIFDEESGSRETSQATNVFRFHKHSAYRITAEGYTRLCVNPSPR